jgi:hypothetical protein
VWTKCETKPILGEEASALMMDYGLLMIWDKAMAVAGGGQSLPPNAPNKPNLPRFWAKNEGARENKANPRRGGLGIDDDYGLLMIRGKAMAVAGGGQSLPPMRQTNPICAVLGWK